MKQQKTYLHTNPNDQIKGKYHTLSTNNLQFRPSNILMSNSPFANPTHKMPNSHPLSIGSSGQPLYQQLSKASPFQNNQKISFQSAIDNLLKLDLNTIRPQVKAHTNYSDDDKIISQNNSPNFYDLEENLEFSVTSQYDSVKLKNARQTLPAMVSLKAKELAKETFRSGVDLICIIDRSGSMEGQKLETVKKTLKLLLNFLSEKDRLCLIQFDEEAQRLTPLKIVTKSNIKYYHSAIEQLQAGGGTSISSGTQIAFEQIKKRKYRNNVTSIFLLSDGQDEFAEEAVQAQLKQFDDHFTIHSFGFGSDHDAEMMTSLCNLKNGSFYFVNDISLLDEFFVDALGGLVSVVGENIEISVQLIAQPPFDGIKISRTYGKVWKRLNEQKFRITLPQLASGNRKDFLFELCLPKYQAQIGDDQRVCKIMQAQLKIHSTHKDQTIVKLASLELNLFNSNEQIPQSIENIDVSSQYYRVRGADIIDDARRACEQQQFIQAQNMIDQALTQITKNKKVAVVSEGIIQDLLQARQASIRVNYSSYGGQQMYQITTNNRNQGGVNSKFDQSGSQIQLKKPQSFQNSVQTMWVNEVQKSKRTN